MKYFYYPYGYFDIKYIQMFLLNKKKGIHKKLEKLMQSRKVELYKLKEQSSIHNVQTVMHLKVNTIPHKSTFSQTNAAGTNICQC